MWTHPELFAQDDGRINPATMRGLFLMMYVPILSFLLKMPVELTIVLFLIILSIYSSPSPTGEGLGGEAF
ncbi:hypothetical protein GCM10009117_26160 [Gangjinia marincola]|uniref:Uncharacterized protein n=1 Tax=Gangjinia marincola TaxID=578463 RepID=A0ABN1MK30_9FLAO